MNLGKEILDKLDTNFSSIEKARFLYIELGRKLTFSTKYQNTDNYSMALMYSEKVDIFHLKTTEVNCRMWSQLYSQLLTCIGIQNEIINEGHEYVEFYIVGKKFVADATDGSYTDLARIKNDDELIGFGYSMYQKQRDKHSNIPFNTKESVEEFTNIDNKIGYNTDKKKNLLEFKKFLCDVKNHQIDIKDLLKDKNIDKKDIVSFKIEYLFTLVGKLNNGYYESKDFIYELEKEFLTEEELKKVSSAELKRTNSDKTVNIIECIYIEKEGDYDYYLLAPNLPIQRFDRKQILELSKMGYGIGKKSIPEIDFPNNFKPGKKSIGIKYKLYKNFYLDKILLNYAEQEKTL